jgi:hypothetical protein
MTNRVTTNSSPATHWDHGDHGTMPSPPAQGRTSPQRPVMGGPFADMRQAPPRPPKVPLDSSTQAASQRPRTAPPVMQGTSPTQVQMLMHSAMWQNTAPRQSQVQTGQRQSLPYPTDSGYGHPQRPVLTPQQGNPMFAGSGPQRSHSAPPRMQGQSATPGHGSGHSIGQTNHGGSTQSTEVGGRRSSMSSLKSAFRNFFSSNRGSGHISSESPPASLPSGRSNSRQDDINSGYYGLSDGRHKSNEDESFVEGRFGPR